MFDKTVFKKVLQGNTVCEEEEETEKERSKMQKVRKQQEQLYPCPHIFEIKIHHSSAVSLVTPFPAPRYSSTRALTSVLSSFSSFTVHPSSFFTSLSFLISHLLWSALYPPPSSHNPQPPSHRHPSAFSD